MDANTEPVSNLPVDAPVDDSLTCPLGESSCAYPDEIKRLRQELGDLSLLVRTDALTGLFNYRHFNELLTQEIERSQRTGLALALIMVDLDFFKRVNDQWGHEAGNHALKCVADVLRDGIRRIDAACRYGGEEMVLLLPGAVQPRAVKVAERLRAAVQALRIPVARQSLRITASFGVAVYPAQDVHDAQSLIECADAQLYRAKQEGRNRVCYPPLVVDAQDTQVTADEKKALLE